MANLKMWFILISNLGIRGSLTWIIHHFESRTQMVNVNNCLSTLRRVIDGVIQDNVFVPLILPIFVKSYEAIIYCFSGILCKLHVVVISHYYDN